MDPIEELLPGYALNALSEEETRIVEDALERDPRYRRLLAELLEDAARLSASHAPAVPSAALRDRVLAEARAGARGASGSGGPGGADKRPTVPRAVWAVVACLVLVVAGVAAVAGVQQQRVTKLERMVHAPPPSVSETRAELNELSYAITRHDSDIAHLRPIPRARPPVIRGGGKDAPGGMVVVSKDGDGVLVISRLPRLGVARKYHAWWWDGDGKPVRAGAFQVGRDGYARLTLAGNARRMQSLTVTAEHAEQADSPGEVVVLVGALDAAEP